MFKSVDNLLSQGAALLKRCAGLSGIERHDLSVAPIT